MALEVGLTISLVGNVDSTAPTPAEGASERARQDYDTVSPGPCGDRDEPSNLPVRLTSLVGREREMASIAALLREPAMGLVTLTGVGGVGKAGLALRVGSELAAEGHSPMGWSSST